MASALCPCESNRALASAVLTLVMQCRCCQCWYLQPETITARILSTFVGVCWLLWGLLGPQNALETPTQRLEYTLCAVFQAVNISIDSTCTAWQACKSLCVPYPGQPLKAAHLHGFLNWYFQSFRGSYGFCTTLAYHVMLKCFQIAKNGTWGPTHGQHAHRIMLKAVYGGFLRFLTRPGLNEAQTKRGPNCADDARVQAP